MCGIAGLVGPGYAEHQIQRMTDRLVHRGPDAGGTWSGDDVHLGHRRLAIIDLSDAGVQPMSYGPFTITYNGEVYNFRELRRSLPGPFRSESDTEVLLHLFAAHGPACVEQLRGMFAFAIWDERSRTLFAARDRLGIKPFYYRRTKRGLAFASEIKALLELGRPATDKSALLDYFTYKYVPAPRTIYRDVCKLPPGHTLVFHDGQLSLRRYWEPTVSTTRKQADAALEELDALLVDAVRSHTISDVPLGVFLSGGLDSSAVVACLERPKTFSIGFDVETKSELRHARVVAEHFGTDHSEEIVEGVDVDEALDEIPGMYDEPFGDSSAWATYVVSREARKHATVALSGDGGDEVFSGYGWYRKWLAYGGSGVARLLTHVLDPFSSTGRSAHRRGADDLARYAGLVGLFTIPQQRKLLAPELLAEGDDPLWYLRQFWREELEPRKRMQWLDLHTYLPDDILTKVDRASMAVSLEVRPPLLDHHLVELALCFDPSLLAHDGRDKRMLRDLMGSRLPRQTLERPKQGFSMPVRRWCAERPELLDTALRRLAEAGVLRTAARPRLGGEQMWSLLVLDRWMQRAG
jgi:asparagine synthase (glutamine-hydrolysing)